MNSMVKLQSTTLERAMQRNSAARTAIFAARKPYWKISSGLLKAINRTNNIEY